MYAVQRNPLVAQITAAADQGILVVAQLVSPMFEEEDADTSSPVAEQMQLEVTRRKLWCYMQKLFRRIVLINVLVFSPKSYREIVAVLILLFQLEEKLYKGEERL